MAELDNGATGVVTGITLSNMDNREVSKAVELIHHDGYECIELSIGFASLINMDSGIGGNVSDPFCVVYIKDSQGTWTEVGRTEIIANRLDGEFVNKIWIKYKFEQACDVKFMLYDCDISFTSNDSSRIDLTTGHHDFLGWAECSLAHIIGMRKHKMKLQDVASGEIIVTVMPRPKTNDLLTIQPSFTGLKIGAFKLFGCCMSRAIIYLEISIYHENKYLPIYKSEHLMTNGNGFFPGFTIEMSKLGDPSVPLKFEIMRFENPSYTNIGSVNITVEQLLGTEGFNLTNLELVRRGTKNIGQLLFTEKFITRRPAFLDYVHAGLEIGCQIVVDFTGSNGNPSVPGTLHHLHPVMVGSSQIMTTDYLDAIRHLYPLVEGYDSDKLIEFWGYGALIPLSNGKKIKSWDFAINGSESNPEVKGMDGVVEAYTRLIPNIELSGPTNFAPIINKLVASKTQELASGIVKFDIIIILTDGEISDMQDTIDAIVAASALPIGILIVGIGNGTFSNMHVLDADGTKLVSSRGIVAVRDNVQFVNFNQYRNNLVKFTEESLAEIPKQLVDSMLSLGKMPSDFVRASEIVVPHNVQVNLPPSYQESCRNLGSA